jgi:hypothetical protein
MTLPVNLPAFQQRIGLGGFFSQDQMFAFGGQPLHRQLGQLAQLQEGSARPTARTNDEHLSVFRREIVTFSPAWRSA